MAFIDPKVKIHKDIHALEIYTFLYDTKQHVMQFTQRVVERDSGQVLQLIYDLPFHHIFLHDTKQHVLQFTQRVVERESG